MNDNSRNDELEIGTLGRRNAGLWGVVGTLGLVAAVLVGWNVMLVRGANRAQAELARADQAMDSLRVVQTRAAEKTRQLEARVAAMAAIDERIETRASAGALAALRGTVNALDERVAHGEERLDAISATVRDQSGELAGVGDSLAVLRAFFAGEGQARLAALEQSAATERDRLASLDREMQSLRTSYRRARWFSAASDVLGLVNFGIIVPHVSDHTGRP